MAQWKHIGLHGHSVGTFTGEWYFCAGKMMIAKCSTLWPSECLNWLNWPRGAGECKCLNMLGYALSHKWVAWDQPTALPPVVLILVVSY